MAGEMVAAKRPAARSRQVVQALIALVVVAVIFVLLFRRIDLSTVLTEIRQMTWLELGIIAAIAVTNLLAHWFLWVAVAPGLRVTQAATVALSGTAVTNGVPGGSAIGVGLTYAMLNSWGFSRGRSTIAVLISGIWNNFIKFALPVLALALLALQGDAGPQRIVAGLVGLALLATAVGLFALVLRNDQAAARAGELAGRLASWFRRFVRRPPVQGWGLATVKFRNRAAALLQRRWLPITAAALASHLTLFLVLLVSLRQVGVSDDAVGWAQVLAVFAFARLVTAIRFTPGGAGVVEAVLITGLVAAGGERVAVTAAVLVFRALTWLLPVPIGILTYVHWRRRQSAAASPTG